MHEGQQVLCRIARVRVSCAAAQSLSHTKRQLSLSRTVTRHSSRVYHHFLSQFSLGLHPVWCLLDMWTGGTRYWSTNPEIGGWHTFIIERCTCARNTGVRFRMCCIFKQCASLDLRIRGISHEFGKYDGYSEVWLLLIERQHLQKKSRTELLSLL